MLLTVQLFNKGSFLGSLINKCRQVVRIKNDKRLDINPNSNISNSLIVASLKSPSVPTVNVTNEFTNRPAAVANISLSSPITAVSNKITLEERVGLPLRPKKPLTPYFRFMKELRPKLIASNPGMSLTDVVKEVSKKWEYAEVSLKQRLQEEYKKEQKDYIEKRTKYEAKITDEQRLQIKELKQQKLEAKERRMMRKRIKQLDRPKKPASGFLRFIAKERIRTPQTDKQTFREWQRAATTKWSSLSEGEKNIYLQEARKELETYK